MKRMKWQAVAGILALSAAAVPAMGQSEGDLRDYFEGRRVVVLVDMPADEDGINIEVDKGCSINRRDTNRDLSRFGTSIREGDLAEITLIKTKGKHIEFQLNGGGWQGGRSVGLRYTPAPKSARHQDIEAELALLPDPSNENITDKEKHLRLRRILEEDLEDLAREYDAVNAKRLSEAQEIQAREQEDLNRKILVSGSRFNLRFNRNVPPEALTPEGIMGILEKYVDFSEKAANAAYQRQQQRHAVEAADRDAAADSRSHEPEFEPASAEKILKYLRKGLEWEDVLNLLGSPSRDESYNEGKFHVRVCTFDRTSIGIIDAEFVEDVLVSYSISSR